MLKRMIKGIIRWAHRENEEPEAPKVYAQDVLAGAELTMVAYKIANGYILRISHNNSLHGSSLGVVGSVIYCQDEADIGKQIVAHRAKEVIAPGQSHPRYGANPVYTAQAVPASLAVAAKSSSI